MSELIKYTNASTPVPSRDKHVAREAKSIYDQTRLQAFQIDGQLALAGKIMEGVAELESVRRSVQGDDPVIQLALADVMKTALSQVADIQRGTTTRWEL